VVYIDFMLLFLLYVFSDYFEGYSEEPKNVINERQILISNQIYLFSCFFDGLSPLNSNGGAINAESSNIYRIFISYTTFLRCFVSSGYCGGSMYISIMHDGVAIERVCGYSCGTGSRTTNGYAQFAAIIANSGSKSRIVDSSIVECYKTQTLISYHVITMNNGYSGITGSNISSNNVYHGCGLTFGKTDCSILYSTLSHNVARDSIILYIDGGVYNISKLNLVNNSQLTDRYGIIRQGYLETSILTTFKECVVYYNTNSYLIYRAYGTISFVSCIVDHKSSLATYLNEVTSFSLIPLYHFATNMCKADLQNPTKELVHYRKHTFLLVLITLL